MCKKKKIKSFFINLWDFLQTERFKLILGVSLIVLSALLMVSRYFICLERLWRSACDFGTSIAIFFVSLYGDAEGMTSGIAEIPKVDLQKYLPFSINALEQKIKDFSELIFDRYIFAEYNNFLSQTLFDICFFVLVAVALMIVPSLFKMIFLQKNNKKAGEVSRAYSIFCLFIQNVCIPFFNWLGSCASYVWKKTWIRCVLIIIWLINLNFFAILLGAFGYYFYFMGSYDIASLLNQGVKLFIDIVIMFSGLPSLIWVFAFGSVAVAVMFSGAYDELRHMEAKNCGFLKTTSYIVLIKGEPGLGKTTLATDFALSWENIYKADALEIMMAMEMLFPAFSFQSLRVALNEGIASREIFCVPACDTFVEKLCIDSPAPYLYNTKIFATERNTGTSRITLEKAMKTYSRAYFIYANDNSTMANYPIRFDGRFDDSEHLKKWDGDFFKRSGIKDEEKSRYAHILNQDILRIGKKIDPQNRFNGTFGYGIYVNTEWGKSRGNKLTTDDVKKSDETTNQKNDLYSYSLKMCRHANSTIWHKVFFRFIGDEQRPESLSADQRELCSIIDITDKSELKLALPFGKLLDKTYECIYTPFIDFYTDYLNVRSDVILSVWLMKFGVSFLSRIYSFLYNTFGYYELTLSLEKGSDYGKEGKASNVKTHIYYLMCKKVYSDRYNTDCHSAYFTKRQLEAGLGIMDYPSYESLRMTPEEMQEQRDYFINDMMNVMNYGEPEEQIKKKTKEKVMAFSAEDVLF